MSVTNKELMDILSRYESVDTAVIRKNLNLLFGAHYKFKNQTGSKSTAILAGITHSTQNTVMAWRNSGRSARIPLMKLLQIADAFDVSFECFLSDDSTWIEDEATREMISERIKEMEDVYGND